MSSTVHVGIASVPDAVRVRRQDSGSVKSCQVLSAHTLSFDKTNGTGVAANKRGIPASMKGLVDAGITEAGMSQ